MKSKAYETEYGSIDANVFLHRENREKSMDIEEYLVGVVAAEMPVSFEKEALKAQAVAARTFTVRHMKTMGGSGCKSSEGDVCTSSSCCQAYKNVGELKETWGKAFYENIEKVRMAVNETRGEIITYDGKAIEALFHSNAGGKTEAAVNVFSNSRPYLQSVKSPDSNSSHGEKTYIVKNEDFADKVNDKWNAEINKCKLKKEVEIISRFEGGRVEKIRLGNITATGKEIRKLFSLESANFEFEFLKDSVIITTFGYGHGVGMSQHGANVFAQSGKTYKEILTHFYTDTKIEHITLKT